MASANILTMSPEAEADEKKTRTSRACLSCRGAKMRCLRQPGSSDPNDPCVRCAKSKKECVVPDRKLGRKAGSVNRFTELNRALRQASDQLGKRSKKGGASGAETDIPALLTDVLLRGMGKVVGGPSGEGTSSGSEGAGSPQDLLRPTLLPKPPSPLSHPTFLDPSSSTTTSQDLSTLLFRTPLPPVTFSSATSFSSDGPDRSSNIIKSEHAVLFAGSPPTTPPEGHGITLSNPLTLLSEVCTTTMPSPASDIGADSSDDITLEDLGVGLEKQNEHSDGFDYLYSSTSAAAVQHHNISEAAYFRAHHTLANETDDPDLDPINIGIVSEDEVEQLFNFFHEELRAMTLALDPVICTAQFVRKLSPFLLTAVCACAAQFSPLSNQGMTTRLYKHYNHLADICKTRGYKSISIIHAFTLGTGWTKPARHISEEKAWSQYTTAASIAMELGLHTTFSTTPSSSQAGTSDVLPWADELRHCATLPGYEEAEIRVRRHCERAWLHLYLWGTGLSGTMGRPWVTRPEEFSPEKTDSWHRHPFAMPEDAHSVALLQLRRLVHGEIIPHIPASMATRTDDLPDADSAYRAVKTAIDARFTSWRNTWLSDIDTGMNVGLYCPYPSLLWKHQRVLVSSLLIKHHQADSLRPLVVDCLKAAIEVVQLVVAELEANNQLRYMVNNICSMCLYSAVCAFKCVMILKPQDTTIPIFVIGLLGKLAKLLEHVGSTPSHRLGTSRLCGQHLRALLITHGSALLPNQIPQPDLTDQISLLPEDGEFWLPFTDSCSWWDVNLDGLDSHGLGSQMDGLVNSDDFSVF